MIKRLFKIVVSGVLLILLVSTISLDQTLIRLSTLPVWLVPLGIGIYLFSQWISSLRWRFLAKRLGFELPLQRYYALYLTGMFFNLFLPGSIGGDLMRVLGLANETGRRKRDATLTLLAERGVGLVALLILSTGLTLVPQPVRLPLGVAGLLWCLFLLGVIGFLILRFSPWPKLLQVLPKGPSIVEWLKLARPFWADNYTLGFSVALSLVPHLCMVFLHSVMAYALGLTVPPVYLALVYGVVVLVSILPVSFNGIGVREGAYVALLAPAGVAAEAGLAYSLTWFMIASTSNALGGICLLGKPLSFGFYHSKNLLKALTHLSR